MKAKILLAFFLLILPWIVIILGLVVDFEIVIFDTLIPKAWYFVLAITWFGSGVIFFGALK